MLYGNDHSPRCGRKGFSDLLVLVLGMAFFLIAALLSYDVSSSERQASSVAESAAGSTKLDFYAQCIQADYYNNLLQSKFEDIVVTFLMTKGPHTIDPEASFRENLGGRLEEDLSAAAGAIISGDASKVYAEAYSKMPGITCAPVEKPGAWRPISLREEKGVIILSGLSVGEALNCKDSEVGASVDIDLQGRGYALQTRALLMFRQAVEAINMTRDSLGRVEGVAEIANGWRLASDQSVKPDIMGGPQGWASKIAALPLTLPLSDGGGVAVDKASIRILDSDGRPYTATDIAKAVCYGGMNAAAESNSGPTQTCRPDSMTLELGLSKEGAEAKENAVVLKFERGTAVDAANGDDEAELEILVKKYGIETKLKIPELGKIIAKALGDSLDKVFESIGTGVVTYGGTTHLCNAFKGKPDSTVVSGRVTESDKKYLPAGMDYAYFDFMSTPQALDTSGIENGEDCNSPDKEMMESNVVALLTNYGKEEFEFNLVKDKDDPEGTFTVDDDTVNETKTRINENDMVASTGEGITVEFSVKVEGGGATVDEETPPDSPKVSTEDADEATMVKEGDMPAEDKQSETTKDFNSAVKSGNTLQGLASSMKLTDSVSTTLASAGATKASESVSKATAAICKLAGLKNLMEIDDTAKALFAVCGIARIASPEAAQKICGIASIYAIAESGDLQALVAALNNLLAQSGYGFKVDAAMLADAFNSGKPQDILAAAASAARLSGEAGIANLLTSAGQIIIAAESGDVSAVIAAAISALGEELGGVVGDLSGALSALNSLNAALDSGNPEAALRAISQLVTSMGLKNLPADLGALAGIASTVTGAVDAIMNLDEALDACKGKVQWDWVCTAPQIGEVVCGTFADCVFTGALPAFDPELLCNELIFDLGFRVDCTCVYECPHAPYIMFDQVSWGVNLNYLRMLLDMDKYKDMFADFDLEALLQLTGLMEYCKLDP